MLSLKDINFRRLNTFIQLGYDENISMTAAYFGVSKSAISQDIRFIEEKTQIKLFELKAHEFKLTAKGKIMHKLVIDYLEATKLFIETVKTTANYHIGELNVVTSYVIAEKLILPYLSEFQTSYPSIKLNLIFLEGRDAFLKSNTDIVILPYVLSPETWIRSIFRKSALSIYCAPTFMDVNTATSFHDFIDHVPYIKNLNDEIRNYPYFDEQQKAPLYTTSDLNLQIKFALDGLGFTVINDLLVNEYEKSFELVNINQFYDLKESYVSGSHLYAYYPPSKKESELIHTFLDYFKEGNTPKKQVTVHNY